MNRTDEKVILDFINNFKNAQETFLNGCCSGSHLFCKSGSAAP